MSTCPTCKKPVRPLGENAAFPFCTARCKQVDLYHWLHEDYRIPASDTPNDDEDAPNPKEN